MMCISLTQTQHLNTNVMFHTAVCEDAQHKPEISMSEGSAKILQSTPEKVTLYALNSPTPSDVTLLVLNYLSTAATAAAVMIEYP